MHFRIVHDEAQTHAWMFNFKIHSPAIMFDRKIS
jgi:hypothetical protein